MLGVEKTRRLIEREVIEIAPLAYMRGRTLNKSYIILDEAQNTTSRQMKMFLTRMGPRSFMVVTGDPTQVDLPGGEISGLANAMDILAQIQGIAFVTLDERDIVRHSLVQEIVEAYERSEKRPAKKGKSPE
jgi:phosphate starvation-inducible PhoH-like protein